MDKNVAKWIRQFEKTKHDFPSRRKTYVHDHKFIYKMRGQFANIFFRKTIDRPILNGDQMPLPRNKSSQKQSLAYKGKGTFIKENRNLSRELVTVFKQVPNISNINLNTEYIFKGKTTRIKVVVNNVIFQWSQADRIA